MQATVAQVLSGVQPDMKLIVILRDPVERLYSAFWYYGCMYGGDGTSLSAEAFHATATREVELVAKCVADGASMRRCARELFGAAQQVVKGMYAGVCARLAGSVSAGADHVDPRGGLLRR